MEAGRLADAPERIPVTLNDPQPAICGQEPSCYAMKIRGH